MFLLGVVLLDIIPLPFLKGGGGIDATVFRKFGGWVALVLGLAFPFALGPCAGPVYGAILTLAVDSRSVGTGSLLLLVYSLGLALPFVATSLLLDRLAAAAHTRAAVADLRSVRRAEARRASGPLLDARRGGVPRVQRTAPRRAAARTVPRNTLPSSSPTNHR